MHRQVFEVMTDMTGADEPMDEQTIEQALRWQAATARNDCDWQQFTEWLEAAPQNRQAYDEVALLDDRIARHRGALARLPATRVGGGATRWRRAWAGAAIAASVALVAVVMTRYDLPFADAGSRAFAAQPDRSRGVTLDGGVQVILSPGSSMQVAGRHDQRIALDGSAWFDVPHDPARQLVITAGAYQVRDIGTRFEVVSGGQQLKVAVAEGEVGVVLPQHADALKVSAGQRLLVAGNPLIAEYGEAAADEVAAWREGRLIFRNEPLSMVALELGRHAGVTVTVDPSIADRRFSGVLAIGDGNGLVAELGQIMGLRAQREAAVVHLAAAPADGEPAGR
jgi:transmembrane sensor